MKEHINHDTGLRHYERFDSNSGEIVSVKAEYATMSRRPGIASNWIGKYSHDVYPKDFTTVRGKRVQPPKFYDRYIKNIDPELYDRIRGEREIRQYEASEENQPVRLHAREKVKKAQSQLLKRKV